MKRKREKKKVSVGRRVYEAVDKTLMGHLYLINCQGGTVVIERRGKKKHVGYL